MEHDRGYTTPPKFQMTGKNQRSAPARAYRQANNHNLDSIFNHISPPMLPATGMGATENWYFGDSQVYGEEANLPSAPIEHEYDHQELDDLIDAANYQAQNSVPLKDFVNGHPDFLERNTAYALGGVSLPTTSQTLNLHQTQAGVNFHQQQIQPSHQFRGLRADAWPKALEATMMGWKKNGFTFPEISSKMQAEFGIDRSANVLSKRYRLILERDAEDSGMMQMLKGATPKILRVLQDEMDKMDPETMDEELRREVWEELKRKLPKLVRSLAIQTRVGV